MCSWLSRREWCDVQLLCGGRTFNTHRAVLASASSFLRQLLLSCPSEDSPTLIVLPEFDIEAVSSVLYYIYNGEVVVQKTKLKMFLDLIKAMQIFIDSQYLQGQDDNNAHHTDRERCPNNFEFRKDSNQEIAHIKKQGKFDDVAQQSALEGRESHTLYLDKANASISMNNMQSTHADRQRNAYLRDLFTETYPRNGNGNGLAGGVLEISSERYHEPPSVLLTNANGNHLGDEPVPSSFGMGIASSSSTIRHSWRWNNENKRFTGKDRENVNNLTEMFLKLPGSNNLLLNYLPNSIVRTSLRNLCLERTLINTKTIKDTKDKYDRILVRGRSATLEEKILKKSHILSRGTILNKVMESPWCPRGPNNYKPFKRKEQQKDLNCEITNTTNEETNDSNNNVQTSKQTDTIQDNGIRCLNLPKEHCINETGSSVSNEKNNDRLALNKKLHPDRYSCDECSKTFSQLRNFKYHMSVHRGTREFAATCPVCGKYFNDRGYLSSHMKIHRNRKEYKCPQCPKSFNQRVAYNMHVRIHTGVKPHACEQCGKAFSRKMLLKQHLRTHSGERPYACAHCDRRFADRSNMALHLRLHTGVKPFSCHMCPKAFTKKHHLKSHLNFHTGAKPYSCPRCGLAFTQSSNMRTHFKKCTAAPKSLVVDSVGT